MSSETYSLKQISAGGNVAGRDINIWNSQQITWYQKKFQKLAFEIEQDSRFAQTIVDLEYYNTVLDGSKGLADKLKDGGFSQSEIEKARRQKMKFAKKQEQYKFYKSAQWINCHLFADILHRFDDNVKPLILENADKQKILMAVSEFVIRPIVQMLNNEGADDDYLCYDNEDLFGMVFYLTGICHINWKDYENVQSGL